MSRFIFVLLFFSSGFSAGAYAASYDLVVDRGVIRVGGEERPALTINGTVPGPLLRFREGEEVVIKVTNRLAEDTSLHWHGLLLPAAMDGVPGLSFPGIKPGESFTYKFRIRQSGTYWYHSHSGLQEPIGVYAPIVIDPADEDPVKYDREFTVMLSDWSNEQPEKILSNLKKKSDYYNYNKRTLGDLMRELGAAKSQAAKDAIIEDRQAWGQMRMDPTDIADVSGFTFLLNGKDPESNWTGVFQPGERVRLRFINAAAMSFFDVRIPGLKMTVVQSDGQNVQPVAVDEFRIAVAETYDVIVEPEAGKAYTIFAESMDRSGYARGTLAPREGMTAEIPPLRERPLLTMADMGSGHAGHDMEAMKKASSMPAMHQPVRTGKAPMQHGMHKLKGSSPMASMHQKMHGKAMMPGMMGQPMQPGTKPGVPMDHGSSMPGMKQGMPMSQGSVETAPYRTLVYQDLRSLVPYEKKPPEREIQLRLTGNMERYFWSINDKKYSEAEPIRLRHNERVRVKFVNETMMNHPMHLHGHWMEIDNGQGALGPRKHVVNVKPGETVYFDLTADALGKWAFHCHLFYHLATGMFREVIVE